MMKPAIAEKITFNQKTNNSFFPGLSLYKNGSIIKK